MGRMIRYRLWVAVVAGLAVAGAVGCDSGERQQAEDQIDQVADDAQRGVDELGETIDSVTDDAQQRIDEARRQLEDGSREVREAAVRNGVAAAAEGEFRRHGVTLDGAPDCRATSEDAGQFEVTCTGRTDDGRTATLTGSDPGDGPSEFVGSVEGDELFRQECVGLC